jgi:hypothetical protein
MASPFRFNKKARKRARRAAKRRYALAEEFERKGIKTCWVDGLIEMANLDLKVGLSKRKKNKRHSKPQK